MIKVVSEAMLVALIIAFVLVSSKVVSDLLTTRRLKGLAVSACSVVCLVLIHPAAVNWWTIGLLCVAGFGCFTWGRVYEGDR